MGIYWDYVVSLPADAVAKVKDLYRLNQTVLRLVFFTYEDGRTTPSSILRKTARSCSRKISSGDSFDQEDRPYRSYSGGGSNEEN
jgi:hypothetical protein